MAKTESKSKEKSPTDILSMYAAEARTEFKSTGIACLDELWGGGIDPQGTYAMWGPQGCGKSTLCFQIVKTFCKRGEPVVMVDVEKAFNERQQEAFGLRQYVESGLLTHVTCDNYEQLEQIIDAVAKVKPALLILDSETMIQPVVTRDMKVTDNQPGVKAKQSAYCLNKLKQSFYHSHIPSIILFHARANLNMTGGTQSETKQAGGFAALHIPDILTKIVTGAKIKEGDDIIGQVCRIVCEKNKYTAPFVTIEKKLIYGVGISKKIDLIDTAIERGVITTGGAGYYKLPWGDSVRGTKALYALSNEDLKKLQGLMS